MTSEEKVWQAARFLHEAHRARTPYQPLPDGISPRDINEAYDIQEAFHELLFPERGAIVGYKVALTTTVMQQMVGFGHPASGAVFTSGVHHSPVTINASDYVHVGAECEIAMLLEQDLPASDTPYDRESVARAVAALMPAFELVDDRGADYTDLYFLNVAADNSWNSGIVLGEAVIDWQDIDLVAATGTMTINGQPAGVGTGGDVLGHPLEALAWLANNLAERGKSLQKDMIVMTGSIVSTKFLNKGDEVQFEIDTLGDVLLTVA
ncbi:2-keto-4-pentenoate hydratase [hydrothermal vent metagenome]|uniref:2-keto-4-pentenoate hydratase n=1 Tax=hydrothermal vent metagenome TaxID=652676 RepID=A0A170QB73_9ZZZZ